MSNTNNNLQTQTSSALYNAIIEGGGKDRPLMLAPGNYVQWKSRINRYIDTKPNHELIHFYLKNPPYQYKFIATNADATPATPGNDSTPQQQQPRENVKEIFATVSEDIKKWITDEAVQIILTGIDNDIYSIVDACPNAMEMWKAIERVKQGESINAQDLETNISQAATRNKGKAFANSLLPIYDLEPKVVGDDEASSKEKEIDKLMDLISLSFKKIYKPTNNNLRTLSNTRNMNVNNAPRSNRGTGYDRQTGHYDNQRAVNVARARENVGTQDSTYHKEKMLLCKKEEARIQLSAEQVTPNAAANSGPIFDTKPLQKVHNSDNDYNVFANERQHPEDPESVNDTYLVEQGDTNITSDSIDMNNNGEETDQDDQMLQKEHELLASLIDQIKIKIDGSKQTNKALESSRKALREANTFLNIKLKRYQDTDFVKNAHDKCATAYGLLEEQKVKTEKSFSAYTGKILSLNKRISEMENELSAQKRTISTTSFQKEEQEFFFKTREDKDIEKVINLENQVKVLNHIVYETGQSVQTMIMLNQNCNTSFFKPQYLKKAQSVNPLLKLFKTPSLEESSSLEFDLFSDLEEHFEEEIIEAMRETMEEYMCKTRGDYGGSDHEDANEHIEKVLEIVDLFHILEITQDQIMLRAFLMSLTGVEVILFYKGLEVPTRQILDFKGAIPTMTAANARKKEKHLKKHITLNLVDHSKKEDNIEQQLQDSTKGTMETLHAAIRKQRASIKDLEIQIGKMSKVLQQRGTGNLPSLTETNLRDHVKSISTTIETDTTLIRYIGPSRYAVSGLQNSKLFFVPSQVTIPFPSRLYDDYFDEEEGSYELKDLDAYSIRTTLQLRTTLLDDSLPREVVDEPMMDIVKTRYDNKIIAGLDEYPSYCEFDRKTHIDHAYNLQFSCMIGYEHVNADFFPLLSINVMSKSFYNSIVKDKVEYQGRNVVGAFMDVPIFVGNFFVVTDFAVIENINSYQDKGMGDITVGRPFCKDACIKARRFDGMITIYKGNDGVTYQMARSHP
ncbi:hypothetical protein Tco_0844677, partial [Tanacetum coccineum]